jgi:hypothetical protein
VQQLTVDTINASSVLLRKQDGHQLTIDLYVPMAYLRFGPGPYLPEENILNVSL